MAKALGYPQPLYKSLVASDLRIGRTKIAGCGDPTLRFVKKSTTVKVVVYLFHTQDTTPNPPQS